jgi:hypothetical protein
MVTAASGAPIGRRPAAHPGHEHTANASKQRQQRLLTDARDAAILGRKLERTRINRAGGPQLARGPNSVTSFCLGVIDLGKR